LTVNPNPRGCVLFDWGGTLMRDFPDACGPMVDWPCVELMPHAAETLATLRARGWRTALATNAADSSEAQIRAALARVGVDHLVDRIYCFARVGFRKPSRAFFAHILEDLELSPSDAVMVGDDYAVDIVGANRAGLRAVWLGSGVPGIGDSDAVRTIADLRDLPAVLDEWERHHPRPK
jgi:putative hydrolase of the HAD superfamily